MIEGLMTLAVAWVLAAAIALTQRGLALAVFSIATGIYALAAVTVLIMRR